MSGGRADAIAGAATPDTAATERARDRAVDLVIAVLAYNPEARTVLRQLIRDEVGSGRVAT